MSQLSISTNDERPWLMTVHEQQKEGSVQLGKKAIDALVSKGLPVTLKNIHDKSKKVDPKGVCPRYV